MQDQVLEVLRMPTAPNALYHASCYEPERREVVLQVLELRPGGNHRCAACQRSFFDATLRPGPIRQLDLWPAA
ncbi:MAG: hypothetical protein J2P37_00310 [Ktedonobacteraceae bacterium]|nr:hypothetical protein [Ktedonobacteraceae bacterium]